MAPLSVFKFILSSRNMAEPPPTCTMFSRSLHILYDCDLARRPLYDLARRPLYDRVTLLSAASFWSSATLSRMRCPAAVALSACLRAASPSATNTACCDSSVTSRRSTLTQQTLRDSSFLHYTTCYFNNKFSYCC